MGSTNGTFVNGVRLPPETPWPLRPEDVLGIGPVQLLATSPAVQDTGSDKRTMSM